MEGASPQFDTVAARFAGLRYSYPRAAMPALDGIDLIIGRGEFIGVIGPTGAGKSTLLMVFNALVPQYLGGTVHGSATVAGQDVFTVPTAQMALRVAMVLEDPESQITATTVEAEVAFALENLCFPAAEMRLRVDHALAAVGLGGLQKKHPANLSGGQKQRLAIAAALALRPEIMVLDEPTSQLDPQATAEVFQILSDLNREGITVIVASHAAEEMAVAASRIIVMDRGRIAAEGPPAAVLSRVGPLEAMAVRPPDVARTLARLGGGATPPVTLDAAFAHLPDVARPARAPRALPVGTAALSVSGLSHVYADGTRALDGVTLDLVKGSFIVIAGRNGSGKSTLVKHFVGLLKPTTGQVMAAGQDVAGMTIGALARNIAFVSQNAHRQLFCDSVADEVRFALRLQKRAPAEVEAAATRAIAEMGLEGVTDAHPAALSRGTQLRVAIAAFLALDPGVLIFDEPTTGQDWRGATAVIDVLRRLQGTGRTVVLVTHHMYLLGRFVDRMIVMDRGQIRLDGPPEEVLYAGDRLAACGVLPPQTVLLAAHMPGLAAFRPIGPDDLEVP